MKWEKAELSLIAQIGDGAHSSLKRVESGIPYLTAKNITKNGVNYLNIDFISEDTYEKYFKEKSNALTKPQKDDILYSIIGSIGGVYCVKDEKIGISSSVAIIRANSELIFPQYLAYFIKSKIFDAQVHAIKGGVAQGFMSIEKLKNINILYPNNLDYQAEIVSILSAYDDLIENNQKQIKLLEEAAQRLYKEWFVDLRFPGYETTPIIDGVPEGWDIGFMCDIAVFQRGQTITQAQVIDGDTPVVAGGIEPAYYHNKANTVAPVITVSASGANAGFTRLYNVDVFASDCSFVDSRATEYLYFVYGFLKNHKEVVKSLQKGSAQPHVYAKDINNIMVIIPDKQILLRYCNLVKLYFEKMKILQVQIEQLTEARDRLLPKLMSGKIMI